MKVLHINTYDFGGAATACKRIHLGLLRQGIDSKILLLHKTKGVEKTYRFEPMIEPPIEPPKIKPPSYLRRVGYVVTYRDKHYEKKLEKLHAEKLLKQKDFENRKMGAEMFSFPYSDYDITKSPLYNEADIIQLNWVSGFLDEKSFFEKNTKPVIWRMADLYACGSGYHYEIGFPFDALKPELDENYIIREQALKNKNITFVPISEWVRLKADKSPLIKSFPKKVIHNGVDLNIFKPYNKEFSRKVFNLDNDKTILLFGADSIYNKRKGMSLLIDALNLLPFDDNIQLVTFGNIEANQGDFSLKNKSINIGTINDERLLSILYSAADYFIMPSIEEAFGQVTIEAMASGTPVISFPNGGSLDIIKNGLTGYLSEDFTAKSLANAIALGLEKKFDRNVIVDYIKENFNIEDKVKQYIELYQSLYR